MPVDAVADLEGDPIVVSVSDVHGYRDRLASALLTLADHPEFDPVVRRVGDDVTQSDAGWGSESASPDNGLRWVGGDEFVLVVNGDLVNRGPASGETLALLERLQTDAPDGHVRYLIGNHDLVLPYPSPPAWERFWADHVDDAARRRFWQRVLTGDVAVAFDGHRYTYSHAGAPDGVDTSRVNDAFRTVARELVDRVGAPEERSTFDRVLEERCPELQIPDVDEVRELRERPDAGVVWLDFSFLPADAPPQVVGHTPHETVIRRGNVVCQDTILANVDTPGGETVLVETPDSLRALTRRPGGSVAVCDLGTASEFAND